MQPHLLLIILSLFYIFFLSLAIWPAAYQRRLLARIRCAPYLREAHRQWDIQVTASHGYPIFLRASAIVVLMLLTHAILTVVRGN